MRSQSCGKGLKTVSMGENTSNKILFMGDIHNDWKFFERIISLEKPSTIIQCGDVNYNDKFKPFPLVDYDCKMYFCQGNSDTNCCNLQKITEVSKNLFFVPRGKVVKIGQHSILFLGGSQSLLQFSNGSDKCRPPLCESLPLQKFNMVVSHVAPAEVRTNFTKKLWVDNYEYLNDKLLKILTSNCRWFFSHYHTERKSLIYIKNCKEVLFEHLPPVKLFKKSYQVLKEG